VAQLVVQSISLAGLTPAFGPAAVEGDSFYNDGKTFVHVKNGGAAAVTVTIDSKEPCSHGFDHDISVTIAAGADKIIGPFPKGRFTARTTGLANISYSDVTSVTVAAFRA
jgi:hypothetical protein